MHWSTLCNNKRTVYEEYITFINLFAPNKQLTISSVQFSFSVVSDSLWPHELQHTRPPCLSPTQEFTQTRVHWDGDATQPCHHLSSPAPPALNPSQHQGLLKCQFFPSGDQSIGVSASVLPVNIQEWFPLGWTGWISLQFKGLSRLFSSTAVQKHQFFGAQLAL